MDKRLSFDHNKNHVFFNSFGMEDVLLLLDGLMKIALVASVMIVVATAPSRAGAASHGRQADAAPATTPDQDDEPTWSRRMLHAHDDDHWLESDDQPSVNLDGTPMCGDLDLNGNVYGDCGSAFDAWDGGTSSTWD